MRWDVAVIGGGPAGMMAAARAAEQGARVILLEKNPGLGKKLLITGGGRCNVTNAETDLRALLARYGEAEQFLYSAFSRYGVPDTLALFNGRGMATKVEPGKRVFPVSDDAASVLAILQAYLRAGKVEVRTGVEVQGLDVGDGAVRQVRTRTGPVTAASYVLATGGTSRPETGSTGEGFGWLEEAGHAVRTPRAALVPLALDEAWAKRLQGVALDGVRMGVFQGGTRHLLERGRVLFTHFGITGPMVLNASAEIGQWLEGGAVRLEIDLFPDEDHGHLDARLQALFARSGRQAVRTALKEIVPGALAPVMLELAGIMRETTCAALSKEARMRIVHALKALPLTVSHLMGMDRAVIASGGVSLDEVDFRTMASRLVPNLHLVGDLLDISRPSGGYSLQLCWTTGYVAGTAAAGPRS